MSFNEAAKGYISGVDAVPTKLMLDVQIYSVLTHNIISKCSYTTDN